MPSSTFDLVFTSKLENVEEVQWHSLYDSTKDKVDQVFRKEWVKQFVVGYELGGQTKRFHLQCYLRTKSRIRTQEAMLQIAVEILLPELVGIFGDIWHPIHHVAFASKDGDALADYCSKDTKMVFSDPLMAPYMGEDLPSVWYKWQEECIALATAVGWVARTIHWYYDPNGAAGKSVLAKYLAWKHDACVLGYADASSLLMMASNNKRAKTFVFNLTKFRGHANTWNDVLQTLESIKDGQWFTGKYAGQSVLRKPPHVIVFSNKMPPQQTIGDRSRFLVHSIAAPVPPTQG